jgi:3-oxoacyl-(acyl-carrier-protein) synthase
LSKYNNITASCLVRNGTVVQNGAVVFENPTAALPDFLLAVYQHFGFKYPKFYKMDNLSKLGWLAAEVLLREVDLLAQYAPANVGVVLANASSSLDTDLKYWESTKTLASPALFVYTLPNIVIGEICIKNNFRGENAFFVSEQFDAAFLCQYAHNLLNSGALEACICGWVELIGETYEAVLVLVQQQESPQNLLNQTTITNIYEHG